MMTTASTPARPAPKGTHAFAIGQAVHVKPSLLFRPSAGVYYITATMPVASDGQPQYRIRNDVERHERVTTQDTLEALSPGEAKRTPSERSFFHG